MGKIIFIFVVISILLNLSCSSTNQKSVEQNLEVKSVEPLTPTNEILDVNSISLELIENSEKSTQFLNDNETITKIAGEITDEMIWQDRDLSLYEKTDTSKCNTYNCVERHQREFIWNHWKNKKRGYIRSFVQGIDVSFSENIFIEPNANGEWIVSWIMARSHAMLGNDIVATLGIVSVKKIISKNGKSKLELKNKSGEVFKML